MGLVCLIKGLFHIVEIKIIKNVTGLLHSTVVLHRILKDQEASFALFFVALYTLFSLEGEITETNVKRLAG